MSTDKTIVITGASRGLGGAIAEEVARNNFHLCLVARNEKALREVAVRLRSDYTANVRCVVADVSQYDDLKVKLTNTLGTMPQLHAVVNNAAIACHIGKIDDSCIDEWKKCLDINLMGTINVCHILVPFFKKNKYGKIVNICGGGVGWKNLIGEMSPYITSKFAIYGFTETLANMLCNCSIDVNALSPGSMDTELRQEIISKMDTFTLPVEDDLTPVKAVKMAMFLISEQSNGISGRIISSKWDNFDDLRRIRDSESLSDLFKLRKIDGRNFCEV